mmetsp:Transcript_1994/g.5393  ORF Transcript_1994/g.5393 Transcript_1994/m.5393 type:complete len:341 (-) Transcript_1994:601-1623(-)
MASARISARRCGRFWAKRAKALVVCISATRLCELEMKSRHRLRSRASPACSAIMRYSAALSTVSQAESRDTHSSTSDATSYWCAASSSAMTSLSPSSSTSRAPTYMKRSMRLMAAGSKSLMRTSFCCCSRILLSHMALKTGDLAARTALCARISSCPTRTTTSDKRPESKRAPNCGPRQGSVAPLSGFNTLKPTSKVSSTVTIAAAVGMSPKRGALQTVSNCRPAFRNSYPFPLPTGRLAQTTRSRLCIVRNCATTSEPKIKDMSLFSQSVTSLSGRAHNKSHRIPESGTFAGRESCWIWSMLFNSGERPLFMQMIFSSIRAQTGMQLKTLSMHLHSWTL